MSEFEQYLNARLEWAKRKHENANTDTTSGYWAGVLIILAEVVQEYSRLQEQQKS